jgi:hypothetical protein
VYANRSLFMIGPRTEKLPSALQAYYEAAICEAVVNAVRGAHDTK